MLLPFLSRCISEPLPVLHPYIFANISPEHYIWFISVYLKEGYSKKKTYSLTITLAEERVQSLKIRLIVYELISSAGERRDMLPMDRSFYPDPYNLYT